MLLWTRQPLQAVDPDWEHRPGNLALLHPASDTVNSCFPSHHDRCPINMGEFLAAERPAADRHPRPQ